MKKLNLILAALVFACLNFVQAQVRPVEKIELTLKDCLMKALERNLDIAVQAVEPEILASALREQKNIYWPELSLGYFNYHYNYLTNWAVKGVNYLDRNRRYDVQVTQKVFTG